MYTRFPSGASRPTKIVATGASRPPKLVATGASRPAKIVAIFAATIFGGRIAPISTISGEREAL